MGPSRVLPILCLVKMLPLHKSCLLRKFGLHILGVILVNQYNLKKGKELVGDLIDAAAMAELSGMGGLETYEPQRTKDLT